jgi:hypothetical protein
MTTASNNEFPSVLFEEQAGDPTTPASGFWRAYFKSDGIYVIDDAGAVTGPFGAGGGGHIAGATARRTAGSLTLNSTSETNVDTGLDLTLAAATGDIVTVHANALWGNTAVIGMVDVATIVAGSPVNYFGVGLASTNQGLIGWSHQQAAYEPWGGGATYVLQAGDISGGNVVLRLRYKTASAANLTLFATTAIAFQWSAILVRPV